METSLLRFFVAVAEGATVTEVAEEAFVTQPTVTRGLQRLEAEAGAPLFDRVGRGLRLNGNGEVLLAAARHALADLDGAVAEIAAHQDPAVGTVRLGFLNPLSHWLLPELLGEYRRRFPRVSFEQGAPGVSFGSPATPPAGAAPPPPPPPPPEEPAPPPPPGGTTG